MDIMDEEDLCLAVAVILDEDKEPPRKRRRVWVREINYENEEEFHNIFQELREDEDGFFDFFKMSVDCFDGILELIGASITKEVTHFRKPIEPPIRLAVTMRYLATGQPFKTIGQLFGIGLRTVSAIVLQVCTAIWDIMQPLFLPEPTKKTWEESTNGFLEKWQLANCVGIINGKHITVKSPGNTGSKYFRYLQNFSFVVLAILDPNYKFICIDVGGYGRNCDGGVFEESIIGIRLQNKNFQFPQDKPLPNQNEPTPCVLIGDEGFPLKEYMIRPFPSRQSKSDVKKEHFNKRLSDICQIAEDTFGVLIDKWRILSRPIEVKAETGIVLVKAICVIHNYMLTKMGNRVLEGFEENKPISGGLKNLPNIPRRPTERALQIRERFVSYFDSVNKE